jgi:prevent-host-death family protein
MCPAVLKNFHGLRGSMAEAADGIKAAVRFTNDEVVSVETARDTLGRFVLRAGFGNERVIITYHGEERAALIGLKDLERLRSLDAA